MDVQIDDSFLVVKIAGQREKSPFCQQNPFIFSNKVWWFNFLIQLYQLLEREPLMDWQGVLANIDVRNQLSIMHLFIGMGYWRIFGLCEGKSIRLLLQILDFGCEAAIGDSSYVIFDLADELPEVLDFDELLPVDADSIPVALYHMIETLL